MFLKSSTGGVWNSNGVAQYTQQSLNEEQHTWLHRQQQVACIKEDQKGISQVFAGEVIT